MSRLSLIDVIVGIGCGVLVLYLLLGWTSTWRHSKWFGKHKRGRRR